MPNWNHVLREIQKEKDDPNGDSAADKVRLKYLIELQTHVKRNIICYYSGFLSKPKNIEGMEINDEDKNGFMLCIRSPNRDVGWHRFGFDMTKIISQIVDQIKRHPHINKVIVSKVEWLLIKREIRHLSWVRLAKRPTGNIKNNPWLHIDQDLWDANFKHMRDFTPIEIMGRPVIYREQNEASD